MPWWRCALVSVRGSPPLSSADSSLSAVRRRFTHWSAAGTAALRGRDDVRGSHIGGMSDTPTYAVRPSFLGIERSDSAAPICVAGIPYDLGTSNRPGARFGPGAIRQASRMLVDGEHPTNWHDPATHDLADIGDFRIAHGDILGSLAQIEA